MMIGSIEDFKRFLTYLVIITLPIMAIADISEGVKINFSLADIFVALLAFIFLVQYRQLSIKRNFPFWWYFTGLIALMLIANSAAYFIESITTGSLLLQVNEGIKLFTIALYFYAGYNFINKKEDIIRVSCIWLCTTAVICVLSIIAVIAAYQGSTLLGSFLISADIKRLTGTLTDPNLAAAYLSLSFFIALLFIHISRNKLQKSISYVTLALIMASIVLTQSRSGLIAFFLALAIYLLLTFQRSFKLVPVIFLLLVTGFFGFLSIDARLFDKQITGSMEKRFGQVIEQSGEAEVRSNLARAAFEMGKDYPLLGVGRGNFRFNSQPYYERIGIDTGSRSFETQYGIKIPHNTYLTFFAELGVLGLVLFLTIFYQAFRVNWKFKKVNLIFLALLLSYLIQALAINLENFRGIWFILGIIFATIKMGFDKEADNVEKQVGLSNKKLAGLLGILLLVGLFFYVDAGGRYARPVEIGANKLVEYIDGITPNEEYVFQYYIDGNNPNPDKQSSAINIYALIDEKEVLINEIVYWAPRGTGALPFVSHSDRVKIEIVPILEGAGTRINDGKVMRVDTGEGKRVFADYTYMPEVLESIFKRLGLINGAVKEGTIYSFGLDNPVNLSDKVLVMDVQKQELQGGDLKLTFEFKCIGDMEVDYRIWLHAGVIDKYILPENRLEHGFANWDHSLGTRTSQWEVGETYVHEYVIKANPGQYHNLRFGFWHPEWTDGKTYRLEPSVNIGYIQIRREGLQ